MNRYRASPGAVLSVEWLKLRRSPALFLALGAPLALSALLCLSLLARPEMTGGPYWSWRYYFQMTRAFWGVFVLPVLLAALAAASLGIEHRQDNWKSQLVQPVSMGSLYWAKFLVLVLLAAISQAVLYAATLLSGRALQLPGSPPPAELLIALAVIPAAMPVLAFQFGLSLARRSFVFPIGIGIFAHFVCLVSAAVPIAGVRPGYYLPWSFLLRALRVSGGAVEPPRIELAIACSMGLAILWAAQLHFTHRGRGRIRRPPAERRAAARRYAAAGLAIAVTLVALAGVERRLGARIDRLRRQVARIASLDGTDGFSDLEPFGRAVGTSRVVLLGEASHGDGATLRLKGRLVRYLHERKGFDVLAFESGLYDCLRAGQEILRGADPVEWGEKSIFEVWSRSAEVRPVLEYLGESVERGRPLQLAGFDMQLTGEVSADLLVDDLRRFLSETYPSALETEDWRVVSSSLRALISDARAWRLQNEARAEQAAAASGRLETRLRGRPWSDPWILRRAEFWAQNLESLGSLFRFVRTLDPQNLESFQKAAPIRERAMARNLVWLVERYFPGRKIIVWGATSHLIHDRASIETGVPDAMVPMGQEIRDELGEQSYVVGFTSFEGRRGLPREGEAGEPRDLEIAPQNSLEDLLARAGIDVGFIDLRRADPGSVLASPITARPLGHAPMAAEWGRVLDGLFFIRRMTPNTLAAAPALSD